MKKIMTLAAFAAMTATASAASLTWGFGGGDLYISKVGDAKAVLAQEFTGEVPDGAAFVLVYLGTSSVLDVSKIGTDFSKVDEIAYDWEEVDGVSAAKEPFKAFTVGADKYNANDYFGIAFFDGKGYSSLYAVNDFTEGTIGSSLSPVIKITDLSTTSNYQLLASEGDSVPKDEYGFGMAGVTVPEPSVAILGLLGLGMLLKRRRA